MIKVTSIDFMVPNQANPIGSIKLTLEMSVAQDEVSSTIIVSEEKDVELSPETARHLEKLRQSIIRDLDKE